MAASAGSAAAAAGVASRLGLFSPAGLFKSAATAAVQSATGGKIDWEDYQWPLPNGSGGLIHFDLVELREKRPPEVFNMVSAFYTWHRATLALLGVNLLTTVILLALAAPAYSGVNLLAAFAWLIVVPVADMAVVYKAYHGWAEGSRISQLTARALQLVTLTLGLIHALGAFGNINGLDSFRAGRFEAAEREGVPPHAVAYWKAMTVIESLLWLAQLAAQGWMAFRMTKGPDKEAADAALAKATAKAPAPAPAAAPAPAPAAAAAAAAAAGRGAKGSAAAPAGAAAPAAGAAAPRAASGLAAMWSSRA